jgi:hypothetical protein
MKKVRLTRKAKADMICAAMVAALTFWLCSLVADQVEKKNAPDATELTTNAATVTEAPTEVLEYKAAPDLAAIEVNDYDVELIARTIWGEAGGVKSQTEQAAVAWCILNRADKYGRSIESIVTAPGQFVGYRARGECPQEFYNLAADVLRRHEAEKQGEKNPGRVLPKDYLYFTGDGARNHFTIEWQSSNKYDWTMPSPYTT